MYIIMLTFPLQYCSSESGPSQPICPTTPPLHVRLLSCNPPLQISEQRVQSSHSFQLGHVCFIEQIYYFSLEKTQWLSEPVCYIQTLWYPVLRIHLVRDFRSHIDVSAHVVRHRKTPSKRRTRSIVTRTNMPKTYQLDEFH